METVSLTRSIEAPEDSVRSEIFELGPFMRAAGFDEVTVTDTDFDDDRVTAGTIEIANSVGFLRIQLSLAVIDRPGAVLAYEQREGIFESMTTVYRLDTTEETTSVDVKTDFALDAAFIGPIFDATVVKRQRRSEIANQLDYLQSACESDD